MGTAQLFQQFVVIGLDAQADPIEAFGLQPAKQMLGGGVRIGFKGDLGVIGHVKGTAHSGENGSHTFRAEESGGAAAKIDGVYPVVGRQSAGLLDMGANGGEVVLHQFIVLGGQGVEVAVNALAAAEGDVNINAQGGFVLSDQ